MFRLIGVACPATVRTRGLRPLLCVLRYSYSNFHFTFGCAAMYLCMILTQWGAIDTATLEITESKESVRSTLAAYLLNDHDTWQQYEYSYHTDSRYYNIDNR